MKNRSRFILSFVLLVALVIVVGLVWWVRQTPADPAGEADLADLVEQLQTTSGPATTLPTPPASNTDKDAATDTGVETYDVAVSDIEGTDQKRVDGPDFTIDVPAGWVVHPGTIFAGDPTQRYVYLYSKEPQGAYMTAASDMVWLYVEAVPAEKARFEELREEIMYDDAWVAAQVERVRELFSDSEKAPTAEDYVVENEEVEIGGRPGFYGEVACLRPCYIEGGATTERTYLIPGDGVTYRIGVTTGTNEGTSARMELAHTVVESFRQR